MTKIELVQALSEKSPELEKRDVELAVNSILGQMTDALVQGERIEVRGFGGFSLHHRRLPVSGGIPRRVNQLIYRQK